MEQLNHLKDGVVVSHINGFLTGLHSNYFLVIDESNKLDIREHNNTNYPEEALFSVEDLDNTDMYIDS
jgi:hypothetical protein